MKSRFTKEQIIRILREHEARRRDERQVGTPSAPVRCATACVCPLYD